MAEDWYKLFLRRASRPQRYLCDDCGMWSTECTRCDESKKIHINPRRSATEYRKLCDFLQDGPVPTSAQFRAAVRKANDYQQKMTREALAALGCKDNPSPPQPSSTTAVIDHKLLAEELRKTLIEVVKQSQREVFNKEEAADFLRLSVAQIDKLYRVGELKKAGNSRRVIFARDELLRYLRKS